MSTTTVLQVDRPAAAAAASVSTSISEAARSTLVFNELPLTFLPCEFVVRRVAEGWERDQAYRLRRAVFCAEQGIFVGDDRDAVDDHAQLLVATTCVGGMPDQVVGTVRIHNADRAGDPNVWSGSRLAVHPSFRRVAELGASLIRLAVGTARAQGCQRFIAQVQSQNVPLFERLSWRVLEPLTVFGRPHALMQVDLDAYPLIAKPDIGLACRRRRTP